VRKTKATVAALLLVMLTLATIRVASAATVYNNYTAGHVADAPVGPGALYTTAGAAFVVQPFPAGFAIQYDWVGTGSPQQTNPDVIQVGVQCAYAFTYGKTLCYGEWGTGEPTSTTPVNILPVASFAVITGNFVTATVTYVDNNEATFSLFNNSSGFYWSYTAYVPVTPSSAGRWGGTGTNADFVEDSDGAGGIPDGDTTPFSNAYYVNQLGAAFPLTGGAPNGDSGNDLWEVLDGNGTGGNMIPTGVSGQAFKITDT
jgi:hypothetical protein